MFVFKAAVVGAGTMGGEIAQAIAVADIDVVLKDIDQKFVDHGLDKAREVTKAQLDKLVAKEKLTEEQAGARLEEVMGRIEGTTDYSSFGDVDFVIEAAPERMDIKQAVFTELDAVTPGHAVISSNTSSLSITEMGEATLRPEKVVGFHFFYPASIMPLLEIVRGEDTSDETISTAFNFAQAIKKQPIVCDEVPGFVVNRILNSSVAEVWREQHEKGLSIKKIDEGIAAANAAPMGPFILTDFLGLDTVLHVAEHLRESYGDRFYVHPGMEKLVAEGKLGVKTGGEGAYKDGEPNLEGDADPNVEELVEMFSLKALVEACLILEEGVCTVREIDVGMMAGAGLDPRRGLLPPFWKADVEGLDVVLEKLEGLAEQHPDRFTVPVTLRRLVAQGRLGLASGQGFYAYPQARRRRADGDDQARDPRGRRRHRLARQPADELDQPAGHRRPAHRLGEAQGRRLGPRHGRRLVDPARLLGGRRHQGVHEDGRELRRRADRGRSCAAARVRHRGRSRRSRRSTRSPSAAAVSWRWPATCGSPRSRPSSGSPRSSSGSSPGSAARNDCRDWWDPRRPSR